MSTTIQIKRSSTASAVPLSGDLEVGELAINLADKRLFTKKSDGTIVELSTNPTDIDIATLRIDGVEVTASAAELNSLDGSTASTADLNKLAAITSTATELNKLDGFTGSTAELNLLDGVTATTAELNVLDGITATTTELNYTDGVTSNIQVQLSNKQPLDPQLTDISILIPTDGSFIVGDGTNFVTESGATAIASLGVTATAAELNTLDGITASTTELNYTDGVTSNIQTQLNGKATSAQGALADSAVQPDDNVSFGTGSFSGEIAANGGIALGDNDKATFGAGDDLEIYHDGATNSSYISETGTGNLYIRGASLWLQNGDVTKTYALFTDGGASTLFHNDSAKLATTSTGVDVTGTITADGLAVDVNSGRAFTINGLGNVGIGTASPSAKLEVVGEANSKVAEFTSIGGEGRGLAISTFFSGNYDSTGVDFNTQSAVGALSFSTGGSERARIDSSGNLLVGQSSSTDPASDNVLGSCIRGGGYASFSRSDTAPTLNLNKNYYDGSIVDFRKNGTTVGSIGVGGSNDLYIGSADTGLIITDSDYITPFNPSTQSGRDNAIDIGQSWGRFKDLYLSGGVYLGGTGAANKLDDYEEGTYIPSITQGASSVVYVARNAEYIKIGRVVTVRALIDVNITSDGSDARISLPFVAASAVGSSAWVASGRVSGSAFTDNSTTLFAPVVPVSTATLRIDPYIGGSSQTFVTGTSKRIEFFMTYQTTA